MVYFHHLIGNRIHILWWQETIRAILIFLYGLVIVRFAGRRVFGGYAPIDIILGVLVGSTLSRALTANAPFLPTLAATGGIVLIYWVLTFCAIRSDFASWLVKGRPIKLICEGQVDFQRMQRLGVGKRDLTEAMRESGIDEFNEIKKAFLEGDGSISIIQK